MSSVTNAAYTETSHVSELKLRWTVFHCLTCTSEARHSGIRYTPACRQFVTKIKFIQHSPSQQLLVAQLFKNFQEFMGKHGLLYYAYK
jgi:hypothetical protein